MKAKDNETIELLHHTAMLSWREYRFYQYTDPKEAEFFKEDALKAEEILAALLKTKKDFK